jgi:glycerol-3-phosphate dehydrogenase
MVEGIRIAADFGPCFGNTLYGFEVAYLMRNEWARTPEDVLWRRTNMGLFLTAEEVQRLDAWMAEHRNLPAAEAAISQGKTDAA